jgi:2-keto-4-pentenoate hydratase/2-oxohepta-3-ene-1,7-dioic acid hydratase in catechol pathway
MKLISYEKNGQIRMGVLDGDQVIDLNEAVPSISHDLLVALNSGVDVTAAAKAALASSAPRVALRAVKLAAPVPRPGKIICLGLNYYDHAKEGGRDKPEYPWFFYRGASSLIAHGEAGMRPRVSERLDYEAELAVIIGKRVKHLSEADALSCVFGYSVFNDISVRDYQKKTPQWTIGKNFDNSGPFGPVLVTADELGPGATGLRIQSRLNGKVMQDANTTDMIWGVAETIKLLTECMTLEPGDVIIMGTPAGVGQARTPPVWMKEGDVVEIEIERIGILTTPIKNEI